MEPETKADQEKYPLVLFLHGAGERGDNNRAQLVHGLRDFASAKNRETYPAYVVAPQCPANRKWVEVPWDGQKHESPEQPSDSLQMCNELIDDLIKRYPIDTDRIYVTGLSMGGFGTFDAATRWPERFAAAAPICGGGDESEQAIARLKSVPLWIVHGDADKVVVPDRSRRMVKALTEAGAKPNYIELEGVAHDSWTATYRDDKFFEWLFSQNKANRTPK
jgi:predicted peptidase